MINSIRNIKEVMLKSPVRIEDVNETYIRRSEDFLEVF